MTRIHLRVIEFGRSYGFSIVLLIFFAVQIVRDFVIHNDWVLLYPTSQSLLHPENSHLVWIGRPVGALLLNIQYYVVDSVLGLRLFRLISILIYFISLYVVLINLKKSKIRIGQTTLILYICLPSNLLYFVWSSNFVPGMLTQIILLLCFVLYIKIKSLRLIIFIGLAITYLVYPPNTMLWLTYLFTLYHFVKNQKILIDMLKSFIFIILIQVSLSNFYQNLLDNSFFKFLGSAPENPSYSLRPNFEFQTLISNFTYLYLDQSQLWFLGQNMIGALSTIIISLILIYAFLYNRNNFILFLIVYALVNVVNIFANGNNVLVRNTLAGSSLLFFYSTIYLSVIVNKLASFAKKLNFSNFRKQVKYLTTIFVFFVYVNAQIIINTIIWNSQIEFNYISEVLEGKLFTKVLTIRPNLSSQYVAGAKLYKDYNYSITLGKEAGCIMGFFSRNATLIDEDYKAEYSFICVESDKAHDDNTDFDLVIDMRKIAKSIK